MVEKKQGLQPTKYDEIIVRDRLAIISISGEIVSLTKSIIAKQKVISALGGDAYIA